MVGAYVHWELKIKRGLPAVLAWVIALAACALIGALSHLAVMRQLRRASPLAGCRDAGYLIVLLSGAALRYGQRVTQASRSCPDNPLEFGARRLR